MFNFGLFFFFFFSEVTSDHFFIARLKMQRNRFHFNYAEIVGADRLKLFRRMMELHE